MPAEQHLQQLSSSRLPIGSEKGGIGNTAKNATFPYFGSENISELMLSFGDKFLKIDYKKQL